MKLFEIMVQDIKTVQGRAVILKRKFKRLYRKYWNIAVPTLMGYVGITPVQYQTGKKSGRANHFVRRERGLRD